MPTILIATANPHKVEEYRSMINDPNIELESLLDYPDCPEITEDGTTFAENAAIKALAASKYAQAPAFADDSGLEVAALNGAPGIHSARYAPTQEEKIHKLLAEMAGKTDRSARFVCVIAIAFNGEVIGSFEGVLKGRIADAPRGNGGFGYDPIFIPEGFDKTLAELSPEEKNHISHRGRAFQAASEFVADQLAVLGDSFF